MSDDLGDLDEIVEDSSFDAHQSTPAKSSNAVKEYVKVITDYGATREDELSLQQGDVVEVIQKFEDTWWRGKKDGKEGFFPSTFTQTFHFDLSDNIPIVSSDSSSSFWNASFSNLPEEGPLNNVQNSNPQSSQNQTRSQQSSRASSRSKEDTTVEEEEVEDANLEEIVNDNELVEGEVEESEEEVEESAESSEEEIEESAESEEEEEEEEEESAESGEEEEEEQEEEEEESAESSAAEEEEEEVDYVQDEEEEQSTMPQLAKKPTPRDIIKIEIPKVTKTSTPPIKSTTPKAAAPSPYEKRTTTKDTKSVVPPVAKTQQEYSAFSAYTTQLQIASPKKQRTASASSKSSKKGSKGKSSKGKGSKKSLLQTLETHDIRKYRDALSEKEKEIESLRQEVKTLHVLQKRQSRAIKELDEEKGDMPRLVQEMAEELRVLKEKIRDYQTRHTGDEKTKQIQHEEIQKMKKRMGEMQTIMKSKNLDEVSVGSKARQEIEKREKMIIDLHHKANLLVKVKEQDEKKYRQQMKECNTEIDKLRTGIERYQDILKEHGLAKIIKEVNTTLSPPNGRLAATTTSPVRGTTKTNDRSPQPPRHAKNSTSPVPKKKPTAPLSAKNSQDDLDVSPPVPVKEKLIEPKLAPTISTSVNISQELVQNNEEAQRPTEPNNEKTPEETTSTNFKFSFSEPLNNSTGSRKKNLANPFQKFSEPAPLLSPPTKPHTPNSNRNSTNETATSASFSRPIISPQESNIGSKPFVLGSSANQEEPANKPSWLNNSTAAPSEQPAKVATPPSNDYKPSWMGNSSSPAAQPVNVPVEPANNDYKPSWLGGNSKPAEASSPKPSWLGGGGAQSTAGASAPPASNSNNDYKPSWLSPAQNDPFKPNFGMPKRKDKWKVDY